MEANEKNNNNNNSNIDKFKIFKNFKISRSLYIEWEDPAFDINKHLKGLQK
jgi:hypothetical protein